MIVIMRYSIESAQPPPLLQQITHQLLYCHSEDGKLILVEPVAEGRVCLNEWKTAESEAPASKVEVATEVGLDWRRVVGVWCCEDEWVILLHDPIQLFLVVSKYAKMLEVKLE